jgi:putative membrane protein
MMWWNFGWGSGGWLGMTLLMLVFWGALIWLVATLVGNGSSKDTPPPRRAEDVLAERFAHGEIGQTEYLDRLHVLQGTPGGPAAGVDATSVDTTGAPR